VRHNYVEQIVCTTTTTEAGITSGLYIDLLSTSKVVFQLVVQLSFA
jgi:hypothetical protein